MKPRASLPTHQNVRYDPPVHGLTDYHVHTSRCGHAGGSSRDFVLKGISLGLAEIAFTDHIPLYFLPEERRDPELAMREDQFEGYVEEVRSLAREFEGAIAVRLGLEADYAEGFEGELARWLGRADWDLVLGSVHWVSGGWIDAPGSAARFSKEGVESLYREYYRLLEKAADTGLFDVLTHFDLPKKHGHHAPPGVVDAEDGAIASAVRAGCVVEISSAGLRKPVREIYPGPRLLEKLARAGASFVFSSDAHAPAEVGWGYDQTIGEARRCGISEFVTFEKRVRRPHPLPVPAAPGSPPAL